MAADSEYSEPETESDSESGSVFGISVGVSMTLWARSISFASRTLSLESELASRRMSEAESGSATRTQEMLALLLYWMLGEISFPNRSPERSQKQNRSRGRE